MKDLIEALTILSKYVEDDSYQSNYPTNCSHDVMWFNVDPALVSDEDKKRLEELDLNVGDGDFEGGFYSYKFGSC